MATHLDLEEQEQLDQFKHFWSRWGNLITGLITVVLVIYASWNGWNYWQQRQATQAAVLYDTFEKSVRGKDDALMARSCRICKTSSLAPRLPNKLHCWLLAFMSTGRIWVKPKKLCVG